MTTIAVAYPEWKADAARSSLQYGADTFVIEGGLIRGQTLFYRVRE